MSATDKHGEQSTVDELLCRWAEQTYDIAGVVDVQFEMRDDGAYSEITPGDGPYMEVTIIYLGKQGVGPQRHKRSERHYDTTLIREILAAAAFGGPNPPDEPMFPLPKMDYTGTAEPSSRAAPSAPGRRSPG